MHFMLLYKHQYVQMYTLTYLQAGKETEKNTHIHIRTHAHMQLQPTQILDTLSSPLYRPARIRALVCSSPCTLMLTLGFFAACTHKHTHMHSQ